VSQHLRNARPCPWFSPSCLNFDPLAKGCVASLSQPLAADNYGREVSGDQQPDHVAPLSDSRAGSIDSMCSVLFCADKRAASAQLREARTIGSADAMVFFSASIINIAFSFQEMCQGAS